VAMPIVSPRASLTFSVLPSSLICNWVVAASKRQDRGDLPPQNSRCAGQRYACPISSVEAFPAANWIGPTPRRVAAITAVPPSSTMVGPKVFSSIDPVRVTGPLPWI